MHPVYLPRGLIYVRSTGKNPLLSIQIINDLSLSPSIFDVPAAVAPKFSVPPGPPSQGLAAASILRILTEPSEPSPSLLPLHPTLKSAFKPEPTAPARLYLACALTPYRSVTYEDARGKTHSAAEAAIRDGVKLGVQNHYLDGIPALFASADLLQNPQIGGEKERVRMGMLYCLYQPHER